MMNKKLIGVLVIIWLLVGIVLVSICTKFDWDVILGFSTWVLAAGVFFAVWQTMETKRITNAQIAMQLFREMRDEKAMEKLRSIFDLPIEDFECLTDNTEKDIDYLLERFNALGRLVNENIVDEKLAIVTYGGPAAIKCWYKLSGFIRILQKKRGDYYCEYYESFVRLCLDYFHKEGISVMFYTKEEEEKKDLVFVELQKDALRPRYLQEIRKDIKRRNIR